MQISEIVNFEILEDSVATPDGVAHFIRIIPPNLSIMTDNEKDAQIDLMESLLDAATIPFRIFIMDKIEDMSENKAFYSELGDGGDRQYMIDAIIESMDCVESDNSAVQRAYYLVTVTRELEDFVLFKNLVTERFTAYQVKFEELVTLLRNFILREFLGFDLHSLETQINEKQKTQEKGLSARKSGQSAFQNALTRRLTPQRMQYTMNHIVQNNFLRKVILIKNFPSSVDTRCFMDKVAQIKNTSVTMRLEQMNESQGVRLIDTQMQDVSAKSHDKRTSKQIDAEVESEGIRHFYRDMRSKNSKVYYINIYIEVYAEDEKELRKKLMAVKSRLTAFGITTEALTFEQKDGYSGVYPLARDMLGKSANNMPTPTIAGMFPFSHSSRYDPHGMPLGSTDDGGRMIVDMWARDGSITNGNFCILGETGQGKSHLMKKILENQILRGTSCFALDPENEYSDLFLKMGGTVIDLAGGEVIINPFEIRRMSNRMVEEEESELEAFQNKAVFFQHLSWLKDFFRVLFPGISSKELSALMILTQDMYGEYGISGNTNISDLSPTQYPTFSSLYEFVSDVLHHSEKYSYDMISMDMLGDLLLLLKDTYNGSLGHLLNGHTNITNSRLINFNMQQLLTGSEERTQAVLFNVMTYCWNRISQRQEYIMFVVDELHTLMNKKKNIIAGYLRDFMKRARKYNAIIGTATQQLGDFLNPEIVHITAPLLNAPMFKFVFFPGDLDIPKVQSVLRLSDGEINGIRKPIQGQCLLKAGEQKYLMHVSALPFEEALFGTGGGR